MRLFVVVGLAMLTTRDLAPAAWYCIAAGLLVSSLVFFLRSRLGFDATLQLSPLAGPALLSVPSPSRRRCPVCGNADVHIMSMSDTRRFYGYERFVLYLPHRCSACGQAFEVHPGTVGCYFLACFSALGLLFGLWLTLTPLWIVHFEIKLDPVVLIFGMAAAPALGVLTVWKFSKETRRYWRLRLAAKFSSAERAKPETQYGQSFGPGETVAALEGFGRGLPMTDEHIQELLVRWREARQQGGSPSPEQLCAEYPELLHEVQEQIEAIVYIEGFLNGRHDPEKPHDEGGLTGLDAVACRSGQNDEISRNAGRRDWRRHIGPARVRDITGARRHGGGIQGSADQGSPH